MIINFITEYLPETIITNDFSLRIIVLQMRRLLQKSVLSNADVHRPVKTQILWLLKR